MAVTFCFTSSQEDLTVVGQLFEDSKEAKTEDGASRNRGTTPNCLIA